MIVLLTILMLLGTTGDFRARAGRTWPDPSEVSLWQGNCLCFYQRLRLETGMWSAVFFTEKDSGEDWGDLVAAGVGCTIPGSLKAAAGNLRVQFAHGLLLAHPGAWSAGDPLSLSKAPSWRMRVEPSESPGGNDADPLTGAAAEYITGSLSFAAVLGWSHIDTGSSGLHRSESEIESRHSVEEKLVAGRAGWGPAGVSVLFSSSEEESYERAGADFKFDTGEAVLTGEVVSDMDSTLSFVVCGSRGTPEFRHALTLSRCTGSDPRSSGSLGSFHLAGAGYGMRWRLYRGVVVDAGVLIFHKEDGDSYKAGLLFTEGLGNRTEVAQRLKFTSDGREHSLRAQATATWSPSRDLTLSLKIPITWYTDPAGSDETGTGVEIRLKHSPVSAVDVTLSAAAGSTDGWNSRIYAYSLSFPGEFGSKALYNLSVLLQSAVSVHISPEAVLRVKAAWYNMSSGDIAGETEDDSRTSAGMQLDWSLH